MLLIKYVQSQKIQNQNNFKIFVSNKTKEQKQDGQNRRILSLFEEDWP